MQQSQIMAALLLMLPLLLMASMVRGMEVSQVNDTLVLTTASVNESVENISISVPSFVSLTGYNTTMGNGSKQSINVSVNYRANITVPMVVSWNSTIKTINYNYTFVDYANISVWTDLKMDSNGTLLLPLMSNMTTSFFINVTNNGALPVVVQINFSSPIFSINETEPLYPQETGIKHFQITMPVNSLTQNFTSNITFSLIGRTFNQSIPMMVTVNDGIAPMVSINVSDSEWGKPINIHVNFTDNIGVRMTNIKLNMPDGTSKVWENKSDIQLAWDDKFPLGSYSVMAEAFDLSNNYNNAYANFSVIKIQPFFFYVDTPHDFGKVKIQNLLRFLIFNSSENIPVNISLETLKGDTRIFIDNGGDKMELTMPDANHTTGMTASIFYADSVYMDFMTNNTGYVQGKIRLTYPDYVISPVKELEFFITFLAYEPPQPYNDILFGRYPINCTPQESDTYYDSFYMCSIKYPIDTDFGTLTYPLTKASYDQNNAQYEQKISDRDAEIGSLFTALLLVVLVVVVLIIAVIYSYKIYPILRLKMK